MKRGGVCSLRLYGESAGVAVQIEQEGLRTLCPLRFEEDSEVLRWVGEVILGTQSPRIVTQVGFLRDETGGSDVGRIDMVLVNDPPGPSFDWCALEMQAVYFSGASMEKEFSVIARHEGRSPPFPVGQRRPDYRSSGPKRLMPQLQIKVPTLRRWGKKMAVVVDRDFYGAMGKMRTVTDLSNGDIAWFTVGYEQTSDRGSYRIVRDHLYVTTLERATEGLTGGRPVALDDFEANIRAKMRLQQS